MPRLDSPLRAALSVLLALPTGCRAGATTTPDRDAERALEIEAADRQARERLTLAETDLAAATATHTRAADDLRAAEQRNSDVAAAATSDNEEVDRYAATIAEAQAAAAACDMLVERLIEVHRYLGGFVGEPRRDAAIAGLERCRKTAVKARKKTHEMAQAERRTEFSDRIEASFDAAYPQLKGRLTASVRGEDLEVSIREFFEWRASESQREVDNWCDTTPDFAEIVLRNAHGTFRCRPKEPPKDGVTWLLRVDGLADPWVPVAPGARATPQLHAAPPPPVDPAELERLRLHAAGTQQGVEAASAALAHAQEGVEAVADRSKHLEFAVEGQQNVEAARAARTAPYFLAGGLVATLGALTCVFVGLAYTSRAEGIRDGKITFDTDAERDRELKHARNLGLATYLIGVPIAAVGLTLSLMAGNRYSAASRVTLAPGGLLLRF